MSTYTTRQNPKSTGSTSVASYKDGNNRALITVSRPFPVEDGLLASECQCVWPDDDEPKQTFAQAAEMIESPNVLSGQVSVQPDRYGIDRPRFRIYAIDEAALRLAMQEFADEYATLWEART